MNQIYHENDRQVIRGKLYTRIDPLNTASHLVNIVSGHICRDEIMFIMLLTWAKPRLKIMKLAGQRDSINPSRREFVQ